MHEDFGNALGAVRVVLDAEGLNHEHNTVNVWLAVIIVLNFLYLLTGHLMSFSTPALYVV